MADAHLDTADNAANRRGRGCITRMATTLGVVSHTIAPALRRDPWQAVDETTREQGVERCPEGLAQRGLVVSAQAARARAAATVTNATPRAAAAIATPLLHGHARRCSTPEAAPDALAR
jgi:hypothetical protein